MCKYEILKDAKGKLLRFAEDLRMSVFNGLVPLELENHLILNTKN